jgi:hypothetical protein
MNVWQWLRTMRTESDATQLSVQLWIWRVIVIFSLLALGVGLFTYLVVGLPGK